jgi:septal ring-binding cell division protein DamX
LRAETIEKSAPEPAPESSPAADTAAPMAIGESEPAVEEATAEPATEPTPVPEVAPPPAEIRTTIPSLPGASAFLALPATHYTLVLASVRDPAALDALVGSLDALAGQLFLIKLGMPDGDWYSLCWSEFDDMDAARAARASLPGDAAITSGWPRRIGPLQKEIAR